MNQSVGDALLHAYIDDELAVEERALVETALAHSPVLREREAVLREADASLRNALRPALEPPMPELLVPRANSPSRNVDESGILDWLKGRVSELHPAVALLLVFVAGGLIGAAPWTRTPDTASAPVQRAVEFENALESLASGTTASWRDTEAELYGEVTPVRTYRTATGQFCREFDERRVDATSAVISHGVACREPSGGWRVRLRVYP